jgi:hypothetical protein
MLIIMGLGRGVKQAWAWPSALRLFGSWRNAAARVYFSGADKTKEVD